MSSRVSDIGLSDEADLEPRSARKAALQRVDSTIWWFQKKRIFVTTLGGNSIAVAIVRSEKIRIIKNEIKDTEGIPTHAWSLFFAGRKLEENKTLANYNIEQNSILHVGFDFRGGAHILVKTLTKTEIPVEITQFYKLRDLQTKIFHKTGIPYQQQRLSYHGKQLEDGVIVDQMDMIQAKLLESGHPFPPEWISGRNGIFPAIYLVLRLKGGANVIHHTPIWHESCATTTSNGNGDEVSRRPPFQSNTTANGVSNGDGDEVSRRPPFPHYFPPGSKDSSEIKIGSGPEVAMERADATTQWLNKQRSGFYKFLDMNSGGLLSINPQELRFLFELRKQMSCTFQLSNKTENYVAFKVLISKPQKYLVRPHHGVVSPHTTCQVTVTMQAQQEAPPELKCKDKFHIQSIIVSPGTTTKDFHPNMFEFGNITEECKLKVVYILPSQPPSVVSQETRKSLLRGLSISGNRSSNDSDFHTHSRAFTEIQSTSPEGMLLIYNYNKEKDSLMQRANELHMEAELLRHEENRSCIGVFFFYAVIVGFLSILLGYLK